MEDAYKHEKEIKEAIEHVAHMCSFNSLKDALDVDADETTENRLLPAANKVWPFLVSCLRNKSPLVSDFNIFILWKPTNLYCLITFSFFYLTINYKYEMCWGSTTGNQ